MLPPMEVKFEKVVVDGKRMYKFLGAKNVLGIDALPNDYKVEHGPMVRANFCNKESIVYHYANWGEDIYLNVGEYISIREFNKFKILLSQAGSRLGKFRMQEALKAWSGEEVLIE